MLSAEALQLCSESVILSNWPVYIKLHRAAVQSRADYMGSRASSRGRLEVHDRETCLKQDFLGKFPSSRGHPSAVETPILCR